MDTTPVLDNARAASADLRAQIDLQVKAAETIETRAAAVLTVGAGAIALVGGRLHVGNEAQTAAAISFGLAALALVLCCIGTLATRATFAYGVDGDALVARVGEPHSREVIAVTIADALRQARNQNVIPTRRKFRWFLGATVALVALGLSGAALFVVGAMR